MKKIIILIAFCIYFLNYNFAQGNYYDGIGNETCETLKTALHDLIKGHTVIEYNDLWTHYQITDDHLNDTGTAIIVWDMYSDNPNGAEDEFTFVTDQCRSFSGEGDCFNREHTFPKSWWGGSTSTVQYSDLFVVIPTDGWINGIRGNFPYSEILAGTETDITNNGSAKGTSSIAIPGYTGLVFEPIDEYKGDLARGYFYMATRYENEIAGWENNSTQSDAVLDGNAFTVFEQWQLDLLISWHNLDPVDTKELDRNEDIFTIQGNRNPFIDHPEYVDLIWNCTGCEVNNYITGNITSGTYSVSDTIQSDGIIASTNIVIFDAGKEIILEAGFEVDQGVEFEAIIGGCNN